MSQSPPSFFARIQRCIRAGILVGSLGGLSAVAVAPAKAAERIYVSYSILERSISVDSLETYARTGAIDDDLFLYARYANPDELKQLRAVLRSRANISPVAVSQFLYTSQGEILLQRLGQVIQPDSRLSGFKAIRAALILAAADPEGLTLLNVLRKFPAPGLRIDVERSLQIAGSLERAINQTNQATAEIVEAATQQAATEPPIALNSLADLRQRGSFTWQRQTLTLLDLSRRPAVAAPGVPSDQLRGRLFEVDFYLPNAPLARRAAPVIVISHGLGSDRTTFSYLAQHLASYGFAVLIPEHPGSNAKQLEALINGTTSDVTNPEEFVDRPLDVTYLLNYMERQVASSPALQGRINLQQVGVIGQSFGGYTALALGGAPINAQIPPECSPDVLNNTLNLSLLLQCRAFQPGQTGLDLHDRRVKAIIAMNPIASAVFGRNSIQQIGVPTMIVAGNADTIAPALQEQIQPFTWLTTNDKYLLLLEQGTHFSVIGTSASGDVLPIPQDVIGPSPATARRYVSAMSVAFFQTYLANQSTFRPYLSATYTRAISEAPIELSLVRSFSSNLSFR